MADAQRLYRVTYINKDKVYELYVEQVYSADMWGFVALEGFVFGSHTEMLIDPAEDRLQQEFSGVKRSFVPMQAIIQIDEVEQRGKARITDAEGTVTAFPVMPSRNK